MIILVKTESNQYSGVQSVRKYLCRNALQNNQRLSWSYYSK